MPEWEQRLQASELRSVTSTLKDGDKIQVILIPKYSPPPIQQPSYNPFVKKFKKDPQSFKIDLKPLIIPAAGATITYLIETYGIYLMFALF